MDGKTVYYLPYRGEGEESFYKRVAETAEAQGWWDFLQPRQLVGVKTHFGEEGTEGFVSPFFFKLLASSLKKRKVLGFLTETATLYTGHRSNAVEHLQLAYRHGFTYDEVGLPLIMADGLTGDEDVIVPIKGKFYTHVKIASQVAKANALIVVSHMTGHALSGYGGAVKNLGMGCASRKGKLSQHAVAQPVIKTKKCKGCGLCLRWCPRGAIRLEGEKAFIQKEVCIGCGECLTVCRNGAVGLNWGETYERFQEKLTEYAWGVTQALRGKLFYITFLMKVTKDCDCMPAPLSRIVEDMGAVAGRDPIAVDSAALDLVERKAGRPLSEIAHAVPYRVQIEYAKELGFGQPDYRLVEL